MEIHLTSSLVPSLGYSFGDFITNTGVIGLISLVVVIIYFYFVFRKDLATSDTEAIKKLEASGGENLIEDKKSFVASCVIFGLAVVLLVSHAQTGLTVATIGLFIAVITLITAGKSAGELLKKVDYKTLLFIYRFIRCSRWSGADRNSGDHCGIHR